MKHIVRSTIALLAKHTYHLSFVLFFMAHIATAQHGTYLISTHNPETDVENTYFDLSIDDSGIAYIASKNGVIKYDGLHSKLIDTQGAAFCLAKTTDKTMYVGTAKGLGKIHKRNNAILFELVITANEPVKQLKIFNDNVYAITDNQILKYDPKNDTSQIIKDEFAGTFYAINAIENSLYITTENKGTLLLNSDNQLLTVTDFPDIQLLFAVKSDKSGDYLIGSFDNGLYLFENNKIDKLEIDSDFLDNNFMTTATWLGQNKIILGSLSRGVAIIDINTLKSEETIDYNAGISSNEIRQITKDKDNNILLLSPDNLDVISIDVPIKNYSHYPGLDGFPESVAYYNDNLYVGTNTGLYHLKKEKRYRDVVSYIKTQRTFRTPSIALGKKEKGFFKKKKRKKEEQVSKSSVITTYRKQVEHIVVDSQFVYNKVDNAMYDVNQLTVFNNVLIASGLSGIHTIDKESETTISNLPVRYLYISHGRKIIFACSDDRVSTFFYNGGQWTEKDVFSDFRASINHIIEHDNDVWLCSPEHIFRMSIENGILEDVQEYPLNNPYFDPFFGHVNKGKLHFSNIKSTYSLIGDSLSLTSDNQYKHILIDSDNKAWGHSSHEWVLLDGTSPTNSAPLKMIDDIKTIFHDDLNQSYWVISQNNNVFKFNEHAKIHDSRYTPYIDYILSSTNHLPLNKAFSVVQNESELSFKVTYSDLSRTAGTTYRYRLKNFNDQWSPWTDNNLIRFSFLPAGNFELEIEAKNVFNKALSIKPIIFEVTPPYWKQPWFYAFEFCVIVFMLFISVKLKARGYKYRLFSRLLAFLTLVIILQYMEAIMENYLAFASSPILGFILQVVMALIILPFEGLLKKYILSEGVDLNKYLKIKAKIK